MRIEKIIEILQEYLVDIDVYDFFAKVEEMKTLGLNFMSLALDLGADIEYSSLYLKYLMSTEELEPVAIVVQLKKDKAKDLNLNQVIQLLHSFGCYLYGSFEGMGFLIPVSNENFSQMFTEVLPKLIEALFGYTIKPRVKWVEAGFHQE